MYAWLLLLFHFVPLVRLLNINLRSLERISTQEGFRGKYTFLNIPTHIKQGTNVSVLPGFGYITDSLSVRPSVRSSVYVIIIIILLLVSLRLLPGMTLVCCYMDWPM